MSILGNFASTLLTPLHRSLAIKRLRKLERTFKFVEHRWVVPFAFRSHGFFKGMRPMQDLREIEMLYRLILEKKPRNVVEIGTARGGTLYMWGQACADDATLVSVDLPGGNFGGGYRNCRTPLYQLFARANQKLHLLRADSHASSTCEHVSTLFDDGKVDFLYIDGDHTYEGVKKDFIQYGKLVRPGGIIAMHDIRYTPVSPETQVFRLWDQIKQHCNVTELVNDKDQTSVMGIGVVHVPENGMPDLSFE
jgi:predicted O-methyltransferase YrrM